jgi:hypothetical protein
VFVHGLDYVNAMRDGVPRFVGGSARSGGERAMAIRLERYSHHYLWDCRAARHTSTALDKETYTCDLQ